MGKAVGDEMLTRYVVAVRGRRPAPDGRPGRRDRAGAIATARTRPAALGGVGRPARGATAAANRPPAAADGRGRTEVRVAPPPLTG